MQTGGLIKSLRLLYEWLALVCQIDPGGNIREESLSTKAGRRRPLGGKRANEAEAMRPREGKQGHGSPPRGLKQATARSGRLSFRVLEVTGVPLRTFQSGRN